MTTFYTVKKMSTKVEGFIIGEGYVGKKFKEIQPNWVGTHCTDQPGCVKFDWLLRDTWSNLQKSDFCLLTCSLKEGSDLVFSEFSDFLLETFEQVIVLGSTSAFLEYGSLANPVNEESVLHLNSPQVRREQFLLKNGATIFNLTGIYGPMRSPVTWLKHQRVNPSKMSVNLIHVDDIVKIIDRFFKKGIDKERVILNDGEVHLWTNIIDFCKQKSLLPPDFKRTGSRDPQNRYVSNKKLLKLLPSDYQFTNLYHFLESEAQ